MVMKPCRSCLQIFGYKSMGPGRYREMPAMISSRFSALSSFMKLFISRFQLNTPSVLPVPMDSQAPFYRQNQCGHQWLCRNFQPAAPRSGSPSGPQPQKVHLRSPSSSMVVMVNWVVMVPSEALTEGQPCRNGPAANHTPAACMDVCLGSLSRRLDMSMR